MIAKVTISSSRKTNIKSGPFDYFGGILFNYYPGILFNYYLQKSKGQKNQKLSPTAFSDLNEHRQKCQANSMPA